MRSSISVPISKLSLLLGFFLFLTGIVQAQEAREAGKFEGEIGAGIPFLGKKYGGTFEPGWAAYAEGRYNFRSIPVDIGLKFQTGEFYRTWDRAAFNGDYRFYTASVVSHYNFRRTKNVSPFVGCGVGVSVFTAHYYDFEVIDCKEHDFAACIAPRIGIEFFHHVRLSAAYLLMNKQYGNMEVSIGVVLGGGRRK